MLPVNIRIAGISLLLWGTMAFAQTTVGSITAVKGTATINRGDTTSPAQVNQKLFVGDILRTGPSSQLIFQLEDGSVHTLTSNSALVITEFVYDPANPSRNMLTLTLLEGGLNSVSGAIGAADPSQFNIVTPFGVVNASSANVTLMVDNSAGGDGLVVQNNSGQVLVSNGSTSVAIGEGTVAQIGDQGAPVEILAAAPTAFQTVQVEAGVDTESGDGEINAEAEARIEPREGDPTPSPSSAPSSPPTPTVAPSSQPSPTVAPSALPSIPPPPSTAPSPSVAPSASITPSQAPTVTPSMVPSSAPTSDPSPTASPTPSIEPSVPPPPPPTEPPVSPF